MRHNDFSVRIIGGNEIAGGYVEMEHGKKYSIRMTNHRNVACDAKVMVDGKECGTFRLRPYKSLALERPAHDHGHFTFYALGTSEARQVGLDGTDPNLGLVQITFTPERVSFGPTYRTANSAWSKGETLEHHGLSGASDTTNYYTESRTVEDTPSVAGACASTYTAGGTGLSGHSDQSFVEVFELNYDYSQQTVIHLRLVLGNDKPRPLTSYSTPVPPPVGLR